jgi:hypothetical protein
MSRDTDWHVFDKACDIAAMALKGTAGAVDPEKAGEVFRQIYAALRATASELEGAGSKAGF